MGEEQMFIGAVVAIISGILGYLLGRFVSIIMELKRSN
jgi:hypothetical protein